MWGIYTDCHLNSSSNREGDAAESAFSRFSDANGGKIMPVLLSYGVGRHLVVIVTDRHRSHGSSGVMGAPSIVHYGCRCGETSEPGTGLPALVSDAEEFLDRLAVQMACLHAAEHVENSWRSVKSCGFGRYRSGSDYTPRKGAIRHYMISWRLGWNLPRNDKGCRLNWSMQHMH